jgi:hypothetical protein
MSINFALPDISFRLARFIDAIGEKFFQEDCRHLVLLIGLILIGGPAQTWQASFPLMAILQVGYIAAAKGEIYCTSDASLSGCKSHF